MSDIKEKHKYNKNIYVGNQALVSFKYKWLHYDTILKCNIDYIMSYNVAFLRINLNTVFDCLT